MTHAKQITALALAYTCLALLTPAARAADVNAWKTHTIYQVLTDRYALPNNAKGDCNLKANTYCGGTFQGMIEHLDYIKGLGFDAVWISPVVDNYPDHFHGYAARDITKINSYFGSPDDLKRLAAELHNRDMYLMVDVVANHMGNTNEDFSQNVPFNSPDHYHANCDVSKCKFGDQACTERCRLARLADLRQESDQVGPVLLKWIHDLVSNYSIDGLRVDTAPYVPKAYWKNFTKSAGVYAVGEVFNGDMAYVAGYNGYLTAQLNYPTYFRMKDVFLQNQDMWYVRKMYYDWDQQKNVDLDAMATFTDNHDNARFMSYCSKGHDNCVKLYKSWITFTLTSRGIPILYYGSEQLFSGGNDPYCREPMWNSFNTSAKLYPYVAKITAARKAMGIQNAKQTEGYADSQLYAFHRNKMFVAVTNVLNTDVVKTIINHPFDEGEMICNIFWPKNDCFAIEDGQFKLTLLAGEAKIFVPQSELPGIEAQLAAQAAAVQENFTLYDTVVDQ